MRSYEYQEVKLNYPIIKVLIVELFGGKSPKDIQTIRDKVLEHHLENGGYEGVNIEQGTSETLSQLIKENKAERPKGVNRNLYRIFRHENQSHSFYIDLEDIKKLESIHQQLSVLLSKFNKGE